MQTFLPFYLMIYKVDVFFSPMNILPIVLKFSKIKKILVVHSNLLWLFPKDLPGGKFKINFQRFFTSKMEPKTSPGKHQKKTLKKHGKMNL